MRQTPPIVAMWQLRPGRVCLMGESVPFTTAFGKQKKEGFTVRTDGLSGKTYEWHSRAHGHVVSLCDEPAGWAARRARGPDVAMDSSCPHGLWLVSCRWSSASTATPATSWTCSASPPACPGEWPGPPPPLQGTPAGRGRFPWGGRESCRV